VRKGTTTVNVIRGSGVRRSGGFGWEALSSLTEISVYPSVTAAMAEDIPEVAELCAMTVTDAH